jgi:predicted anti-sigma-YlaC factor YlaD
MNALRCHREDELLEALGRGFIGSELTQHVETCSACRELRTVAGALLEDRATAMREAAVPSAGSMWWRMQLRAQQDAQSRARRSLLIGQAATLLIALALIASLFGADIALEVRQIIASVRVSTPLLIAVATWLILAPVAGYVAIRQK